MPDQHRVIIIAKERPFDAARWQRLLAAFAYVLHEQRPAPPPPPPASPPAAPQWDGEDQP